jgi:hypothetical protein
MRVMVLWSALQYLKHRTALVEIHLHVLGCQRTETICSGKGSSLPVSLAGILVWGNCKEQAYSVQKNVFLWMASGSEFITHDVSSLF